MKKLSDGKRFCVGCAHYEAYVDIGGYGEHRLCHAKQTWKPDAVDGRERWHGHWVRPDVAREDNRLCGPNGKWWKPKSPGVFARLLAYLKENANAR